MKRPPALDLISGMGGLCFLSYTGFLNTVILCFPETVEITVCIYCNYFIAFTQ